MFNSCSLSVQCSLRYMYSVLLSEKLGKETITFVRIYLYSYFASLSNKRQNGWTDRAQILCGTSCDPRKVYGWSNFHKLASNKIQFLKNFKIQELFFIKFAKFGLVFYLHCTQITIETKDGHEAP